MLSNDKKAQIKRFALNALVVFLGAGITGFLQYMGSLDWGPWSALIMSGSTLGVKAVQIWAGPNMPASTTLDH